MTHSVGEHVPDWERLVDADGGGLRFSRRSFLKRAAGSAVLLVASDLFATQGTARGSGAATPPPFFLYGLPGLAAATGPSVESGEAPGAGHGGAVNNTPVAAQLVARPIKSADATKLALVTLAEVGATATVTVTVVDTQSAAQVASGSLDLSKQPDAVVLVTPVFAADSATVGLVLSITTPNNWRELSKLNPLTGETRTVRSASWVSEHSLAYFDSGNSSFSGPYSLDDGPSLARVNVAADSSDLFLWTMKEPAAVRGTKEHPKPAPVPQLAAYPLGSGTARFVTAASDVWPVNEEPVVRVGGGQLARLVYGRQLEVYDSRDGSRSTITIAEIDESTARPARVTLDRFADGSLFIVNPTIGRAVTVNPSASFATTSSTSFPAPLEPNGSPSRKAALSADRATLYALGSAQGSTGVTAYDTTTGSVSASSPTDRRYSGIYNLPSGTLLAVSPDSPRLSFFAPTLELLGTADTNLLIEEVF